MNADMSPDAPMDPALARLVEGLDRAAERASSDAPDQPQEDDAAVAAVVTQLRSHATWDGPPAHLRDTVLARALAERPAAPVVDDAVQPVVQPPPARVPVLVPRWRRLAWAVPMTAAAAVIFTVLVLSGERLLTEPDKGTSYALAGGSYAQNASGTVSVSAAPGGFPVVLEAHNLPGAPIGYYYQAWLIKAGQQPVSLGTFHGRKVGQPIKLWSGVDPAGSTLTVCLQSVNDAPEPTKNVALTARII